MTGSRYVKAPTPTENIRPLYEAVLKVLSGQLNVTEAAATVGLSRLRFQTRLHRGLAGLMEALEDQPRGRPSTPETEKTLRAELEQTRKENQQLRRQVASTARMMGVASEWMKKGLKGAPRETTRRPAEEAPSNDSEDDGPAGRLAAIDRMTAAGVTSVLAAAAVGVSGATARRWRGRRRAGEALSHQRGPAPRGPVSVEAETTARALLDDARGCLGAVALSKASGLSRRAAAAVRADVLTVREARRRADSTRVEVTPGVIRGFDALFAGKAPVLIAADGGLPYRTSVVPVARYDAPAIAQVLQKDFETYGAPLVLRCDRWKAHSVPEVLDVLRHHQVLLLQGPPRCPGYYGQLERQNREHRAWLNWARPQTPEALARECAQMLRALNEVVPRRALGWRTPAAAWKDCPKPLVQRQELAAEVEERRRKLEEDEAIRGRHPGLAGRLTIEAALIHRGLLRLTKGGWC